MKQLSSSRSRYQQSANCGIANGYYSLKALVGAIVRENAPAVLEIDGCGALSAAELGLAAGDNPGRMRSEASLAMLCGASPIEASSGKTVRHRLNRGGNRRANRALHSIVISRMRGDARISECIAKRVSEGKSKREAMRCLKRYIARGVSSLDVADGDEACRRSLPCRKEEAGGTSAARCRGKAGNQAVCRQQHRNRKGEASGGEGRL